MIKYWISLLLLLFSPHPTYPLYAFTSHSENVDFFATKNLLSILETKVNKQLPTGVSFISLELIHDKKQLTHQLSHPDIDNDYLCTRLSLNSLWSTIESRMQNLGIKDEGTQIPLRRDILMQEWEKLMKERTLQVCEFTTLEESKSIQSYHRYTHGILVMPKNARFSVQPAKRSWLLLLNLFF